MSTLIDKQVRERTGEQAVESNVSVLNLQTLKRAMEVRPLRQLIPLPFPIRALSFISAACVKHTVYRLHFDPVLEPQSLARSFGLALRQIKRETFWREIVKKTFRGKQYINALVDRYPHLTVHA